MSNGTPFGDLDPGLESQIKLPGLKLWQMVGFFLTWSGLPGKGRALGAGEVKFTGQVLPTAKIVRYELDIRRVMNRSLKLGIADGLMFVDDRQIYSAKDLRVGLFTDEQLKTGLG